MANYILTEPPSGVINTVFPKPLFTEIEKSRYIYIVVQFCSWCKLSLYCYNCFCFFFTWYMYKIVDPVQNLLKWSHYIFLRNILSWQKQMQLYSFFHSCHHCSVITLLTWFLCYTYNVPLFFKHRVIKTCGQKFVLLFLLLHKPFDLKDDLNERNISTKHQEMKNFSQILPIHKER